MFGQSGVSCALDRVQKEVNGLYDDCSKKNFHDARITGEIIGKVGRRLGIAENPFLRIMTVMCLLGPRGAKVPESTFLDLIGRVEPIARSGEVQKIIDSVIAYGCGMWPRSVNGDNPWNDTWSTALISLTRLFEKAVIDAGAWIQKTLGVMVEGDEFTSEAALLTMQFVHPEKTRKILNGLFTIEAFRHGARMGDTDIAPSGKAVFTVSGNNVSLCVREKRLPIPGGARVVVSSREDRTAVEIFGPFSGYSPNEIRRPIFLREGETATLRGDDLEFSIWACTCGNVNCRARHRITGWDTQYSLISHIMAAVMGVRTAAAGKSQGLVSFTQGMFYPLLNRGFEARFNGGEKLWVRLRLEPVALKYCDCGKKSGYIGKVCPSCGKPFDPRAMTVKKADAFFILEGNGEEDMLLLCRLGYAFERRSFCRCGSGSDKEGCGNYFGFSEEDIHEEVRCQSCRKNLFSEEMLRNVFGTARTDLAVKRELRKKRLHRSAAICPHCGSPVREVPWKCPRCGSNGIGQNLIHLWVKSQPYAPKTRPSAIRLRGRGPVNVLSKKLENPFLALAGAGGPSVPC
ncbi:MAG: hypothetical protein C4576_35450 [Desulfobacteraceae bacterium]|nr:MAG: hypothetical protein C4576_35450 [Desulfobacteraceae bacterium]